MNLTRECPLQRSSFNGRAASCGPHAAHRLEKRLYFRPRPTPVLDDCLLSDSLLLLEVIHHGSLRARAPDAVLTSRPQDNTRHDPCDATRNRPRPGARNSRRPNEAQGEAQKEFRSPDYRSKHHRVARLVTGSVCLDNARHAPGCRHQQRSHGSRSYDRQSSLR